MVTDRQTHSYQIKRIKGKIDYLKISIDGNESFINNQKLQLKKLEAELARLKPVTTPAERLIK